MQSPRISVIVPVYNGEGSIGRCLDSIVSGVKSGVECIVVDDGSRDRTADLVADIAGGNPLVRLIRQNNSGVSAARNTGLRASSGDWIAFVDADDTFVEGWFQIASEALVHAGDASIILFGRSGAQGEISPRECLLRCVGPDTGRDGCPRSTFIGPVSKLYSKAFLSESGIWFSEDVRTGEDLLFNAEAFSRMPRIWFCSESIYLYWKNLGSVTNSMDLAFIENERAYHSHLCEILHGSCLDAGETERLLAFNRLGGLLGMLAKTPCNRSGIGVIRSALFEDGYARSLKRKDDIIAYFPFYRRLQLHLLEKGFVRAAFLVQGIIRGAKRVVYRGNGQTRIERI